VKSRKSRKKEAKKKKKKKANKRAKLGLFKSKYSIDYCKSLLKNVVAHAF